MGASTWAPGSSNLVDSENSNLTQKFTAAASQAVFNLTLFTYRPNTGSLFVYRNGVKLEGSVVSEDTSAGFSLIGVTLDAGELIEAQAVIGSVSASAVTAAANAATAVASASAAAASATSASGSATSASASATAASGSATAASNSVTTANTAANTATTAAGNASTSATNASTSAGLAAGYLAPVTDTSATSITVGTGSKVFACTAGKAFVPGHPVKIARTSDAVNTYMVGTVSAYNSGTGSLTVTVAATAGAGTFSDWTVSIQASSTVVASAVSYTPTGTIAAANVQAAIDELASESCQKSANLSDLTNAATARGNLGLASGAITTVGTAATLNVGTGANNVVQLDGAAKLPALDASQLINVPASGAVPTGAVFDFAGSAAPTGYLLCYGQAVSRTTYSALFTAISTTYGAGDGSTTFNLPDARGRVTAGVDNMGGTAANRITSGQSGIAGTTLGAAGGAETVTLTTAQMPSHSHNVTITSNDGTPGTPAAAYGLNTASGPAYLGVTVSSLSGSGNSHNNTQPTLVLNKIIKT